MNYYDTLRNEQYKEEARQDKNDQKIHKHFIGSLKPSDEQIIKNLGGKKNERSN